MNTVELKTSDAVTLAVPANLQSITTYVLLEQETWFEKEMDFLRHWLRPGMTVIDVGANLGVYSLPLARLVGGTGQVFAYEPGSEPRSLLELSRKLNMTDNLHISPFALSDCEREGRLLCDGPSELGVLGDGDIGEAVHISSLDAEDKTRGWPSPDFLKVDAEGEEERILAGGHIFFARHSPLVMFEIKDASGNPVNEHLRTRFPAIGYRPFRLIAGAPILVPDDARQPLDGYELNLFAAKPDRVSALSQQGFLVDTIPTWVPNEDACKSADAYWQNRIFAPLVSIPGGNRRLVDSEYRNSLAAYATWRATDQPVAMRYAALSFALDGLRRACARAPTTGRLSTLARVAWEWGARNESVGILRRLLQTLQGGQITLGEPFWPACARFEHVPLGSDPLNWFVGAVAEQFERTHGYSSMFSGPSPYLAWLCDQPFASAEMKRRRTLIAARAGLRPAVPALLCQIAPDNLNAEIWGKGKVPGTNVGL